MITSSGRLLISALNLPTPRQLAVIQGQQSHPFTVIPFQPPWANAGFNSACNGVPQGCRVSA